MKKTIVLAFAGVSALGSAQITFEEFDGMGNPILSTLSTNGYDFNGVHFHTLDDNLSGALSSSGSEVYLGHEGGDLGRAVTMTKSGGGLFSVGSVRAGELWTGDGGAYPNAGLLEVHATFADDSTSTTSYALDGIRDGVGGVDDFQLFNLNLANVKSVRFNGISALAGGDFAFGIDDITLNVVPEPATLAVLGLGVAAMRRRKRA